MGLGLLAVTLAWRHAAGTTLVPLQVPALVAAMVGVGLVGTALAAIDLHLRRRHDGLEAEALADAVTLVRQWAEHRGPVRTD
jgi:cyanate permease